MSTNLGMLKRAVTKYAEEDIKDKDGNVLAEKGSKLIRAARCPQCGLQYPGAIRVYACNNCGFKIPKDMSPTDNQINRHNRRQRQQKTVVKKVK